MAPPRKLPSIEVLRELREMPIPGRWRRGLTYNEIGLIYDTSAPAVYFALNPEMNSRRQR